MIPLRSDPSSSRDSKGLPCFRSIPMCRLRHGRQRRPGAAVWQTGPTRCPCCALYSKNLHDCKLGVA
jgi:hypothetical protein